MQSLFSFKICCQCCRYHDGPFGLSVHFAHNGRYLHPRLLLKKCIFSILVDKWEDVGCPFDVAMMIKSMTSPYVGISRTTFSSNVKVAVAALKVSTVIEAFVCLFRLRLRLIYLGRIAEK